ncbi:ricin-type beta-trefoil lectin domain protein [Streptomyces sp. NPDC101115]|uniref:ricin-type beta-trefoil lectin domain protein n=1 Tax=Streptomyces sp. NPDC101115 TaxID=3366106 RepID=UPI003807EAEC
MLVASMLPAQAFAASPGDRTGIQLPELQQDTKAPLDEAEAEKLEGWAGAPVQPPQEYEPTNVAPPAAGSASVALTPEAGDQLVQAGSLPVALGKASPTEADPAPPAPSGTWAVAVESRTATEDAAIDGAIIKLTPPAAGSTPVDVQLDYKRFEDLYGTEWATRLELKQLPECFLTTPELPECSVATDVPSSNDPATGTVRATVDPSDSPVQGMSTMSGGGPVVLTASDGAAGAGGTFKATSLSPSGSWTAGGSGGGFTWSYPLATPKPPAGPVPKIALTYSSQSVDGKTSVANGQASWIGDGWDYAPGFVERRYRTCSEDREAVVVKPGSPSVTPNNDNGTDKKKGDLCWAGDSVVVSVGGGTNELVHDDATGAWVGAADDGSRFERKTDAALGNGAKDGEYWLLTTRDGTRYYFGRHDVDGAGSRKVTDSVFTVPVFGNHPGEPCHATAFADSSCTQAWRWNLDYVEDVHGNAMIIDWARETNHYAKNGKFKEKVSYVRGGYPTQITYGLRTADLNGAPAAKVVFKVGERCVAGGSTECSDAEFESKNYQDKQPWWDTPSTLHCKSEAGKDCYIPTPTFWSRKRLVSIETHAQRTEGSTALSQVDQWNLVQSFPKQRTDTAPPLWLESITRVGFGTEKDPSGNPRTTQLPPVTFLPNVQDMPNRVSKSANDATPDFDRLRVETIRTETGGEVYVDYSDPCAVGTSHPKPEENTTRCYPVHWSADTELETPPLEWFNKYVVERILEKDRVARQPDVVTAYTYEGGGAWAKDTDEFTKPELRTYNQWRGYASVLATKGVTADTGKGYATEASQTRVRYFRGMSGDAGRPQVTVKDSTGKETLGEDLAQFQGQAAETITYAKAGGSPATRLLVWPQSQKTASRTRPGTTPLEAYRTHTSRSDKIMTVGSGERVSRTLTTYETDHGLPVSVQTETATPNGTGGWTVTDPACTTTTYVHNTAAHIIGLNQRVRVTAGTCAEATGAILISDSRTSYDALGSFGTAPVKGLPFQVDEHDAAGTGWVTAARYEYDSLGRVTKATDAAGNATSTTFTPATGPAFSTTATNALGHQVTTRIDPGRELALSTTDANNRTTTTGYDHFGRSTSVWLPGQRAGIDKPAYAFEYRLSEHEPPAVTSRTLRDNGTYGEAVAIYDGLLRKRQTQSAAVGGGRVITDTLYNANGTVRQTNNGYYTTGEPDRNIFVPETVYAIPNSTQTAYDGLNRPVRVTTLETGTPKSANTTTFDGDSVLVRTVMSPDGVTPLAGSRSTRTTTDALGRTKLLELATSADLSTWNKTTYEYNPRGKLSKVTDAAGNVWTYTHDARGRLIASSDPDMGPSTFGYNGLDQQIWFKDGSGREQHTTYDALGRKTALRDDSPTGPLAISWAFDTAPGGKGHPASATRYQNGAAFTSEVTGYDGGYRPTGTKITIPDIPVTKGLAGEYVYTMAYTLTGKVQSSTVPATPGGLAAERLVTRYNSEGLVQSVSGLGWYTADTIYGPFGEVLRTTSGSAPRRVWTTNFFDPGTGRLSQSVTDRETANPNRLSAVSYGYNAGGQLTSITDRQPGDRVDRQCFAYDPLGQLVEAWTGKTEGCPQPTATEVTPGPDGDGYWQSYRFDAVGNRTSLIDHDLADTTKYAETTYTYGVTVVGNGTQPPTKTQPHALTGVQKTQKPSGTVVSTAYYDFDSTGNTKSRRIDGDVQALEWDRRNKLTSATSPGIGAVAVTGLAGKCLDVEGGRDADGTPVQVYTCNETKAQQWRLTGNTVRALGKCLSNEGGEARLMKCDGSSKQKFVHRVTDKTLYNEAAGACLDISNGNATDGANLLVYQCNGGTNQQWSFDNTTTYVYDAAGGRLIQDNGSSRTLYLGEAEITVNKAGQAIDARRHYSGPAGPTTVRRTYGQISGHSLTVLINDHHGTATTVVEQTSDQAITRRKTDPYGNPRGRQPSWWPGTRTFLGAGNDDYSTGLTHLGAREYDSATGRFISMDPVIDSGDPMSMNGYAYSHNDPVNRSDPSGLYDPDLREFCRGNSGSSHCNHGRAPYLPPTPQPAITHTNLVLHSNGVTTGTITDQRGFKHELGYRPESKTGDGSGDVAWKALNDDLKAAGKHVDANFQNGEVYFHQLDDSAARPKGYTDDGTGKHVVVGTTSDYVKATFVNGKIVSLESYDALSTSLNTPVEAAATTIQNKMHEKKYQTEKVVYVAPSAERAKEMAEKFKNDPRVRVIHPDSDFDNQRVYKAPPPPPVTGKPDGGKTQSRSLKGPKIRGGPFVILTALQSPLYIRDYGWKNGAAEMFLDTVDPFGFRFDDPYLYPQEPIVA